MEKSYLGNLVVLFEANKAMIGPNGEDPNTDTGQDIYDPNVDKQPDENVNQNQKNVNQEKVNEKDQGLTDADYLSENPSGAVEDASQGVISVSDSQKMGKLFDLFKDLIDYTNIFTEFVSGYNDNDLIKHDQKANISLNLNKLDIFKNKLNDYLNNTFENDKYDSAMYMYILLRTELVSYINNIRNDFKNGFDKRKDC